MDIVWQNDDGAVAIWLMDGTDKTQQIEVMPNPGPQWLVVGACDCDGDGNSDILFENAGAIGVWPMDGTSVRQTDSGDPDSYIISLGTGHMVGIAEPNIYLQDGDSAVTVWTMGPDENGNPSIAATALIEMPGQGWRVQGVGDFDHDGQTDLLVRHTTGTVAILFADNTTALAGPNPGVAGWSVAAVGDLNGDGNSDILWENTSILPGATRAAVWFIRPDTAPYNRLLNSFQNNGSHIKYAADFDGDGKSDLLWQLDSGDATIWLMDADTRVDAINIGAPE